jgi:hypothetical protein
MPQTARQRRSVAQISSGPQETLAGHSASAGNWHTPLPSTLVHISPAGQSTVARHSSWHLLIVHTKGWVQSVLMMQVPPTSIFFKSLHPTARQADVTTMPRTRNRETDYISDLQVCLQCRKIPMRRDYHGGTVMVRSGAGCVGTRAIAMPTFPGERFRQDRLAGSQDVALEVQPRLRPPAHQVQMEFTASGRSLQLRPPAH